MSDGQIIVRDTGNQKQDINDLSRDTANAHEKLETIFDKEAEHTLLVRKYDLALLRKGHLTNNVLLHQVLRSWFMK